MYALQSLRGCFGVDVCAFMNLTMGCVGLCLIFLSLQVVIESLRANSHLKVRAMVLVIRKSSRDVGVLVCFSELRPLMQRIVCMNMTDSDPSRQLSG